MTVTPAPQATAEPPAFQEPWAPWRLRVLALLLDSALGTPFIVIAVILATVARDPESGMVTDLACQLLAIANSIASLAFAFWNHIIRQGRRGASLGKQAFGLLVLSLGDARPIGPGLTFIRYVAHFLDSLPLGLGYLWPLWDKKKQTFADKLMFTGVLRLPGVRF